MTQYRTDGKCADGKTKRTEGECEALSFTFTFCLLQSIYKIIDKIQGGSSSGGIFAESAYLKILLIQRKRSSGIYLAQQIGLYIWGKIGG